MDTIVLKFGGSSVANNEKLRKVAKKIIDLKKEYSNIVVVLSAQGKTTDNLIEQAKELSEKPDIREMDMLLSSGEQMSIAKLSILLNSLHHKAISLTGPQAGIITNNTNQNAIIKKIDTSRIKKELNDGKIVIVAGFQGINSNNDIATLGRGGSDTTAVAIAAALKAKKCYIFSDVDGVYTTDPNKVEKAKKMLNVSYDEMLQISEEGAKVLHNRCVEIAERFNIPIVAKSTFNDKDGSTISEEIEANKVKSIVKKEVSRISIIGNGIIRNTEVIQKVIRLIDENKLEILTFDVSESKISIVFKSIVDNDVLELMHKEIIEKE
ncbi:MAG: aspartate kinase [Clostridia bacterium]|nr:aspartate kinase [Clostridia bacterium]